MAGSFFFLLAMPLVCRGRVPEAAVRCESSLHPVPAPLYGAPRLARYRSRFMEQFKSKVAPAAGKLAGLLPGMGALATTSSAGLEALKAGRSNPPRPLPQRAQRPPGQGTA